jgi:uncharacterized protein
LKKLPEEQAQVIVCRGASLIGILHRPEKPLTKGVLIVTGGPQYRVGSHRQFLLLARYLSDAGIPVLRFDYRGMGDSGGTAVGFETCEADIRAAIDCFLEAVSEMESVVVWGLCDAASALMMYGESDPRVSGMVLLNPWARTDAGQAKTLLKHYYVRRLFSGDFWRGLLSGRFAMGKAIQSLAGNLRKVFSVKRQDATARTTTRSYIDRMKDGLAAYDGQVLLIISGDDLTAAEFDGLVKSSNAWRRILRRQGYTRKNLPAANHTFSSAEWRRQVEIWTRDWVRETTD